MLAVTWPLLRSLRLSSSTIMITTEVDRIHKVFLMLWVEVTIKDNKSYDESFATSGPEYGPIAVDSWGSPSAYICMVSKTVHMADRLVWKTIWENQVR